MTTHKKLMVSAFIFMGVTALCSCKMYSKNDVTLVLKAPTLSFSENGIDADVKRSGDFLKRAGEAFAE